MTDFDKATIEQDFIITTQNIRKVVDDPLTEFDTDLINNLLDRQGVLKQALISVAGFAPFEVDELEEEINGGEWFEDETYNDWDSISLTKRDIENIT